jgi:DNA processing protein
MSIHTISTFTGPLERLLRLKSPPKQLHTSGNDLQHLLKKPVVAIVGTRKPTPYGKQVTERLIADLVRHGVVIVSGLAFGVDSIAHRSCLEYGGETIAVLPSSLATIYPASHRTIAARIIEKGCLVSEYIGTGVPRKHQFIDRNRIIAALADAVIIPEAAVRSGSLHTVRFAQELQLPVGAVPGPITSQLSEGTNKLLSEGGAVITSYKDIARLLGVEHDTETLPRKASGANDLESRILQAIDAGIGDVTLMQAALDMPIVALQQHLSLLELKGLLKKDALGHWYLA